MSKTQKEIKADGEIVSISQQGYVTLPFNESDFKECNAPQNADWKKLNYK